MPRRRKYYKDAPYHREGPPPKPIHLLKSTELRVVIARLCEEAGVVVRRGKFNRQIIHLVDVLPLLQYLSRQYRPVRSLGFDRLSLTMWLSGLEGELEMCEDNRNGKRRLQGKAGYARRLELEIHRISKLAEPTRTVAAVEFMQRVRDARSVVEAAKGYLKDTYGDLSETRYAGGAEWWRELEKLAGLVHGNGQETDQHRQQHQLALPSADVSSSSSSSSS